MCNRFCPTCGTTICWTIADHPDLIGIALGTIESGDLPSFDSLWERAKHDWISIDAAIAPYPTGYPGPA